MRSWSHKKGRVSSTARSSGLFRGCKGRDEELWGGAAWMAPSAQGTSLQLIFKCLREWLTAGVQNFKGKASRHLDCLWDVTVRVVLTTPGDTARSVQLMGASEGNAFSYMGKGDTDNYIHKWHFLIKRDKDKILQQQQEKTESPQWNNSMTSQWQWQRLKDKAILWKLWRKTTAYPKFSTQISCFRVWILDQSEFFRETKIVEMIERETAMGERR